MQEYLQIKIGNDSNETMTINLTNYDRAKTDEQIKNAMDQILEVHAMRDNHQTACRQTQDTAYCRTVRFSF